MAEHGRRPKVLLEEFAAIHLPALNDDEVRNNLLIAVIKRSLDRPQSNLRFWSLGDPGACAVQSPHWPVILGNVSKVQCGHLARTVKEVDYPAVLGPDDTATWFRDKANGLGRSFLSPIREELLSIGRRPYLPDCAGEAGDVKKREASLFADWIIAFHDEILPHDPEPDRRHLEARATDGNQMFWRVDGEPVSVAAIARRTQNAATINSVYTPPALRRRGYAGAVTATLVERIYREGRTTACLFVNADDPRSTGCYRKIGFRTHCRFNYYPVA